MSQGFLTGKKILLTGLANKQSIAYGIGSALVREGAEVFLSYPNEKLGQRVYECAKEWGIPESHVVACDVSTDANIIAARDAIQQQTPSLDGIIHAIAFAPKDELNGSITELTTKEGFSLAHDVSVYSFIALAKYFQHMLSDGASLQTLTYYGAEKAVPNYNVMGLAKASLEAAVRYMAADLGPKNIRVNAISAGPIRTLAAMGISHFRKMLAANEKRAPLRRNVSTTEVGNVAAFLSSDMASGVTGEVIHVDCGFHVTTMVLEEAEGAK